MYFLFQFLYRSSLFACSVSAFILFWDLGSSLLSLLWVLLHVDCISPLHLVVLLGFYHVLSSGTYPSGISFCLTFCDCGFCCTDCGVVVLASAFCPLVDEAQLRGLCRLPGGSDCFLPTRGWTWVLTLWWAGLCQGICLAGSCGLRKTQPVCWWVGLCSCPVGCLASGVPALEPTGCWVGPDLGEKIAASRTAHANEYSPEVLPPMSLSLQWATAAPCLSRRPSDTSR